MRVLLDTHALLWFLSGDSRLSVHAHSVIAEPYNEVLLSVGSLWEITIKARLGKLTLDKPFEELIPAKLAAERIEVVPIEIQYLAALRQLPFHHRDPVRPAHHRKSISRWGSGCDPRPRVRGVWSRGDLE